MVILALVACLGQYGPDDDDPVPTQVALIGPEGGELVFGDATLVVPEGALSEQVELRLVETEDPLPENFVGNSSIWRAEPAGLLFDEPVEIHLPVDGDTDSASMFWQDGDEYLALDTRFEAGVAIASVSQFTQGFVGSVSVLVVEEENPMPPADLLFVVDNSCSMFEEQTALADAMSAVLPGLEATGVDYHLGVVSTDMSDPAHTGKLREVSGFRYVDPSTPDGVGVFSNMVIMGTAGDFEEKGRAAAYTALEPSVAPQVNAGFYRDDASLTLVFVSDEEDQSGGVPISRADFRSWLGNLKLRPEQVIAHGFFFVPGTSCPTASDPGQDYFRYTDWSSGVAASICDADWAADLGVMTDRVLDFGRVELPVVASSIERVVFIDGSDEVELDPSEYTWDPGSMAVYFDQGVRPDAGETVRVEYLP